MLFAVNSALIIFIPRLYFSYVKGHDYSFFSLLIKMDSPDEEASLNLLLNLSDEKINIYICFGNLLCLAVNWL